MFQPVKPLPRLAPLPPEHTPELAGAFDSFRKSVGFIPNSLLIMQRRPKLVRAFAEMAAALWDPEGSVDHGFKRLVGHVSSRASGCRYCQAHTAGGAMRHGIDQARIEAVWEYQTSPLFSLAERAALDVAFAAGCVPNEVTDEMMATLSSHWSEAQIVEIVSVISIFGFWNRWNDTLATPLEEEAVSVAEAHLAASGWEIGRHERKSEQGNVSEPII